MELKHLSVSTIDSFINCSRKAYLSKSAEVAPSPERASGATEIGSAVHTALEIYHKVGLGKHKDLPELFEDVCRTYQIYDFSRFTDFRALLARYEKNNPAEANIVGLELDYYFEVAPDLPPMHGFIDRIDYLGDGTYEIIDYKTSFMRKDKWELENDLQLVSYNLALLSLWEEGKLLLHGMPAPKPERVLCSLYFIRYDKVTVEFTEDQLDSALKFIKMMGYRIQAMEGEPRPSANPFCYYCTWKGTCPLYTSDFSEYADFQETKDIDELLSNYSKSKDAEKALKKKNSELQRLILSRMDHDQTDVLERAEGTARAYSQKGTYVDVEKLQGALKNWKDYATLDVARIKEEGTQAEKDLVEKYSREYNKAAFIKVFPRKR